MTFSVGTKGAIAGNEFPNNLTTTRGVVLPDSVTSNLGTQSAANTEGIHSCMRLGQQVLVQMPDGSQRWCVHSNTSKGAYPVLIPVGP